MFSNLYKGALRNEGGRGTVQNQEYNTAHIIFEMKKLILTSCPETPESDFEFVLLIK